MAKCDLTIELEDPGKIYQGGDTVRGTVKVDCDADVHCKELELKSGWRTHGRGNVDTATEQTISLFTGDWRAGSQTEYPFEIRSAIWPPSYQGYYLNIEHFVSVRAKIPWAFDPKASETFVARCPQAPVDRKDATMATVVGNGIGIAIAIGLAVMGVFLVAQLAVGFGVYGSICFGVFAVGAIALFLFTKWLPKFALGDVQCHLESSQLVPGERLRGELVIANRRKVTINQILVTLSGKEVCVSGSGSNQTTHRKTLFEQTEQIGLPGVLQPGATHRFPIDCPLPAEAPCTVSLGDNKITWDARLRVDIPLWPDWFQTLPLVMMPSDATILPAGDGTPASESSAGDALTDSIQSGGITFAETVQHLWDARDDHEQRSMLIDVVSGMKFDVSAIIERRLLYSGDDGQIVYKNGHAIWARYTDPGLLITLYIPGDWADEFEQISGKVWEGRGTILGWDAQHHRLQIKCES